MGVNIKSMKYEDFKDNEYIEKLVEELKASGTNVIVGKFDDLINWGRANSLWPLCFGTSCCAIEFMCLGAARYDMARFGFEITRNSPRQGDVLLLPGTPAVEVHMDERLAVMQENACRLTFRVK